MTTAEIKVKVSKSGPCERTLNVTVVPEAVRRQREKVITDFRREARIKGFRPGKAPRDIITRRFAEPIKEELLKNVITENIRRAIEQEEIVPLSRPEVDEVDLRDDDELQFVARFEVSPEIKLQRYTKFRLNKKIRKVSDEDVNRAVDNLRQGHARFLPKTGAAEKGDYLLIDFCLLDEEGKPKPDTASTNQLVEAGIEDPTALFSHRMVGLTEGDNKVIEIDFPEDYPEEPLRGQKVIYRVDVKSVREKTLPELDDHFAGQVSGTESMDRLREMIRENMEKEIEQQADKQVEDDLFKKIIEANHFDIPSTLVESTIQRYWENYKKQNQDLDEDRFRETFRPAAEFAVRREYVIVDVALKEKIEVTDDEIQEKIEEFASKLKSSADKVKKDFRSPEARNNLRSLVHEEKVVRFLLEKNDIEQVEE